MIPSPCSVPALLICLLSFCALAQTSPSGHAASLSKNDWNQLQGGLASAELLSGSLPAKNTPQTWVILFVSARCPCSAAHEERMRELAKTYASSSLQFLGIHSNADEPPEEGRKHFANASLGFPILQDSSQRWLDTLAALKTPHAFIVDAKSGVILYQGGIDDSSHPASSSKFFLKEALEDLRLGQPIQTTQTRALGCQIRRKSS